MAIYRFKVCLEDNEDVYRDIEIKAAQNFEDFHAIIQEAFKFDSKHASSFFVSDDYWRKGQEITLRKEDLPLEEEEIRNNVSPKKLMKETKIAKFIEQPHQRFVYVFDPAVQWTFLIEMIKISEENNKVSYPSIIKSMGNAPKQYKLVILPKEENPEGEVAEDDEPEEEEIFKAINETDEGVDDDEMEGLEGEEGEEEETAEEGSEPEGASEYSEED